MRLNLLWPAWCRIVQHWPVTSPENPTRWRLIRRAANLLVDKWDREHDARRVPPWHRHVWVHQPHLRETACALCSVHVPMRRFHPKTYVHAFALIAFLWGARAYGHETLLFRALGLTNTFASATDAVSTEVALTAGGLERNPLERNRAVRLASHVAAPIVTNATTARLYRAGHKKTAVFLRFTMIAVFGYATAQNLRELRR